MLVSFSSTLIVGETEQTPEKAMEYLVLHPETPHLDQGALNVVCNGLWKKLDLRGNFHVIFNFKSLDINSEQWLGIIHFVSRKTEETKYA